MKPLISLILPVYNVNDYLNDCLKSLLCQDIPEDDYEIVIVDDGSNDKSNETALKWVATHKNIILITQKNHGVCSARNQGFKIACGEYVWFIDSDDMIASNCIGKICLAMKNHKADIFEMNSVKCEEYDHFKEANIELEISGYNKQGSSGSGCLSVCRRGYLLENDIIFNENLSYGEDYLWAFQTKYRNHTSIYTNQALYYYRMRQGSAMHNSDEEKTYVHMQDMLLLYDCYKIEEKRCVDSNLPEWMVTNIPRRKELCIQSALVLILKLKLPKDSLNSLLSEIKKRGYYPYKIMWWTLTDKNNLSPMKLRLLALFFPFEFYFRAVCALYKAIFKLLKY